MSRIVSKMTELSSQVSKTYLDKFPKLEELMDELYAFNKSTTHKIFENEDYKP